MCVKVTASYSKLQPCAVDLTSREISEAEAFLGLIWRLYLKIDLQLVPADMTLGFRENDSGFRISDLVFSHPRGKKKSKSEIRNPELFSRKPSVMSAGTSCNKARVDPASASEFSLEVKSSAHCCTTGAGCLL